MDNKKNELDLIENNILKLLKIREELVKNNSLLDNDDLKKHIYNLMENKNPIDAYKKILYLGPEGSYTQDAAIKKFGYKNNFISINSISNIFEELEKDNAPFAVVPIENSLNGLVNDTINAFLKHDLYAVDEVILDIHHTFASNCLDINSIKKIYSKDIAFSQCSGFLEKYNLHNVEHIYVESTTKAAILASQDENAAAICSKVAAIKNNVNIMFNDIEDDASNKTRFLILNKNPNHFKENINYKTSFMIQLPNHVGSLIDFLQKFKEKDINLYKIKSHITKGISNFFIEFDGHFSDKNIIEIFSNYENNFKIIGSYKKIIDDI